MAVSGKKINELDEVTTLTEDSVLPAVVVNSDIPESTAKKVSISQLNDYIGSRVLPTQTGKEGKVLTTDGTDVSWESTAKFIQGNTQNDVEFGQSHSEGIDWDNLQIGDRLDNKATYVGTFNAEDPNSPAQSYAVFVLDAVYRSPDLLYSVTRNQTVLPWYNATQALTAKESSTYNTNQILGTYNDYPNFNYARNAGSVIINGTTYYSQLPNVSELLMVWSNRVVVDQKDITSSSNPTMALSNWDNRPTWTSTFNGNGQLSNFGVNSSGSLEQPMGSTNQLAVIPVFEIPLPLPAVRYTNVNRVKIDGVLYQIQDKSQFLITDTTSSSITISELEYNTIYQYGTIDSLTISTLPSGYASSRDRYIETVIYFTSGVSGTAISLPAGLSWISGAAPTIEGNKKYVISICNGAVISGEF